MSKMGAVEAGMAEKGEMFKNLRWCIVGASGCCVLQNCSLQRICNALCRVLNTIVSNAQLLHFTIQGGAIDVQHSSGLGFITTRPF